MYALSIIMPCYNRAYDLGRVLEAYDQQAGEESFELIAIDDASSDSTYQVLSTYQPKRYSLRVVGLEHNQGPANARNQGIGLAEAPLILIVGDDIIPDIQLVSCHMAAHRRYTEKEIAILGKIQWPSDLPVNTLMKHIDGVGAQQFSYHYFKDDTEFDYRHFYTANISVKKEFISLEPKLFDTSFPHAAFEDVELSYRLSKRGLRIIYQSQPIGYHYHYHTIWSFSSRQFKAGLMAHRLVEKHPSTQDLILGKNWSHRIRQLQIKSMLQNHPIDTATQLEARILQLLSSFEWTSHSKLDHAYLVALRYFFIKGIIHSTFKDTDLAIQTLSTYAKQVLSPLLDQLK